MAETVTNITRPAPFIEAAGKTYLTDLQRGIGSYKKADLSKTLGPQFVAGLDPLQQQAQGLAVSGIGGYQPFLQQAQADAQQASQFVGPQAYQQFMSPYQKDIIDTTLQEFDVQSAKGLPGLAQRAISAGAFGGGREGVQRAELGRNIQDIKSKRIAEDLQTNYLQALSTAQAAQEGQRQRQLYAGSQMGSMGQRTAALGLSGQQATGRDIATLSGIGAIDVTQRQAEQEALRQNILAAQEEPFSRINFGANLLAGVPQSTTTLTQAQQPNPYLTALQTGILGLGVLSGNQNLGSFLSAG